MMGIARHHRQRLSTSEPLDHVEVHPGLNQPRREDVPKVMEAKGFQPDFLD